MHRLWSPIVKPILDISRPLVVVEIGAGEGLNTNNLLTWCAANNSQLHSIDPSPGFDAASLEADHEGVFHFYQMRSLEVLRRLPAPDAVLIDGDHNWYTVFNELKLCEEICSDRGLPFPLVLLHDISWPYGRRDMYYDPETIPEEHRKPYLYSALSPDSGELAERTGFNFHLANEVSEGGPQSGVLTAVEDFVSSTAQELRFTAIAGLHGLGILLPKQSLERMEGLSELVSRFGRRYSGDNYLETVEHYRLKAEVRAAGLNRAILSERERAEQLARELTELRGEREAALHEASRLNNEIETIRSQLAAEKDEAKRVTEEVALLSSELAKALRDKEELEEQIGETSSTLSDVRRRLDGSQQQLRLMRNSKSWRVTEPMRIIVFRIRQAREKATSKLARLDGVSLSLVNRGRWLLLRLVRALPMPIKSLVPTNLRAWIARSLARDNAGTDQLVRGQRVVRPVPNHVRGVWWSTLLPTYRDRDKGELFPEKPRVQFGLILERLKIIRSAPSVVIPVFNAPDELEACLHSLIKHTSTEFRAIVVDDASTDPRIPLVLDRFERIGAIETYRNDKNVGFAGAVNRGIKLAGRSDVVLLNSDTRVGPGWLRNLMVAAYSGERIGTATPLSNNAGAFSAPETGKENEIPRTAGHEKYARAISQVSLRRYPTSPTGHGFCMYIRRACLDDVGLFDEEGFPAGYGEENDFCMRAQHNGWTHVVDDATYIYHEEASSFGNRKLELVRKARKTIDERYPGYTRQVREFLGGDALRESLYRIRQITALVREDPSAIRPRVLYVLSTNTGGVPNSNQDLMEALEGRVEPFVLRCDRRTISLMYFKDGSYVEMERYELAEPLRPFPHRSTNYDKAVAEWLVRYAIDLVHIRHISWHSLGLIEVSKAASLPVVFSFHDFYTICPTVNLVDETQTYCDGKCTDTSGDCEPKLWNAQDIIPLKHAGVHHWRDQIREMLMKCDAFITTAKSTKSTLVKSFPFLGGRDFRVIPHGRDFDSFYQHAGELQPDMPLRVLVAGNINIAKGGDVIVSLAELAPANGLEIHVLGRVEPDLVTRLVGRTHVVVHGGYERNEFAGKTGEIRPHIGAVLSIMAESFSHTLTEMWACGIPVVGFNFGAVAERIRETGAGWIMTEPTAESIIRLVRRLRDAPQEHGEKVGSVLEWQISKGGGSNSEQMCSAYFEVYQSLIEREVRTNDVLDSPRLGSGEGRSQAEHGIPTRVGGAKGELRKTILGLVPFTSLGNPEPTGYIRVVRPLSHESMKSVLQLSLVDGSWDESYGIHDCILVQRDAVASLEKAERIVERTRNAGMKLVYEIDDLLLGLPRWHPAAKRFSQPGRQAIAYMLQSADTVVVSTLELERSFREINPNVVTVPNALDETLWRMPGEGTSHFRKNVGVRILYMGSRTHDDDLALVLEPIRQLIDASPDRVAFACLGGFDRGERPKWVEEVTLPGWAHSYEGFAKWMALYAWSFDIGLAPLRDSEFNRHKSPIKYLDYGICGIAPIVSSTGPYADVVRHGETGLVVSNTSKEWYEAIRELVSDEEYRVELGRNARYDVLTHHTLAAQASERKETWTKILS